MPCSSWAKMPASAGMVAGSVIFSVRGPVTSPNQVTSNSSPGLPPYGKTAVGRGNLPTCKR